MVVSCWEMRSLLLVAALALVVQPGCGADCSQSADIQVTVAPNGDVAVAAVSTLHVTLVINDGAPRGRDIALQAPMPSGGSAFILRPDPPPSPSYTVNITVEAIDGQGNLLAIGSESQPVVDKGCNRLTVHLAAVPGGTMMSGGSPDFAGLGPIDFAGLPPPADLSGCIGGMPDEDADGRANFCDLCPADPDSTPVDSDGDALPDACDPDPMMAGNRLLYFDPFDSASGHWSGNHAIAQSYMTLDSGGIGSDSASNAIDMLPLNVRVQTYIFPTKVYSGQGGGDSGVFVGTSVNIMQASGVFCALTSNDNGPDSLDIYHVSNGSFGIPTIQNLGQGLAPTTYRLRLTQRGNNWTCEAVASGLNPVTVTTMQTVTAPLFMTLQTDNMQSHFHSVVAETALP